MKRLLLVCLASAVLPACSSVSVKNLQAGGSRVAKPQRIYVAPFSTEHTRIQAAGKQDPARIAALKQSASTLLADYTVQNVSKHVAPASKVSTAAGAPKSGWLVNGRISRLSTGNRSMRVMVGLGVGATKMETEVEVFDLAASRRDPFLRFTTTGGSNAMPGLITSGGPGVAATYSMLAQASSGVTDDAARTSRMITGALSEYHVERGWLRKDKVFRTKKPGKYQLIHGM
ncbi:MAG TPA: DUF4410 domain-containing protein [Chthoniobacteraceae bacterium]|jgi:hypothetical protein|nr:putative lipoprotein [Chthoniobacter sp.]HEV7869157.1 DUF4410 domain-containing protein [Chthoniobacteraceae bacterium]